MRIIVIGGAALGNALVQLGVADGHQMVLVEADEETAEAAAREHDALVLNASITGDDIMEEAGANQADALIATTGDDAANLMAMVLGQEAGIESLTSVVNHASHRKLFERLGVQVLADPESLVARHLLGMVLHPAAEDVTHVGETAQIYELRLQHSSPLAGKSFQQISEQSLLPDKTYIVSVERGDKTFFPRDSAELAMDDQVIVFARKELSDRALSKITGSK